MPARAGALVVLTLVGCATAQPRRPPPQQVEREVAPATAADEPAALVPAPVQASAVLPVPVGDGPDAQLFRRAEQARTAGDPAAMKRALLELVRDHPTSPFVPHGYFAFGELFFADGRMDEAKNFFEKAAQFADSDVMPFALHRIAWCRVNLGEHEGALNAFVNAARAASKLPAERGRPLAIASVFDSVGSFVHIGRLDKAADFYRYAVRDTEVPLDPVLARVATTAVELGRAQELAKVCRDAGMPAWCSGGPPPAAAPRP